MGEKILIIEYYNCFIDLGSFWRRKMPSPRKLWITMIINLNILYMVRAVHNHSSKMLQREVTVLSTLTVQKLSPVEIKGNIKPF